MQRRFNLVQCITFMFMFELYTVPFNGIKLKFARGYFIVVHFVKTVTVTGVEDSSLAPLEAEGGGLSL